jgi:hypothetical protein
MNISTALSPHHHIQWWQSFSTHALILPALAMALHGIFNGGVEGLGYIMGRSSQMAMGQDSNIIS